MKQKQKLCKSGDEISKIFCKPAGEALDSVKLV